MSEKRAVVVIGGGYGSGMGWLIAQSIINAGIHVVVPDEGNILGTRFDKVIVDEIYPFNELYGIRNMPVPAAYMDYDQPKSQKPWKAGYIPQHGAGPSYYPSNLLLSLVECVK